MSYWLKLKKFLDCGKLTFLTTEKIILKENSNVSTIKTYILNLEQKLSSLVFFVVDKVNIVFSRKLKHKY